MTRNGLCLDETLDTLLMLPADFDFRFLKAEKYSTVKKEDQSFNRYDIILQWLWMVKWLNSHLMTHFHTPNLEMLLHLNWRFVLGQDQVLSC